MAREINEYEDIIDSRDVIERINELTEEWDDLLNKLNDARTELEDATLERPDVKHDELELAVMEADAELTAWKADNLTELESLRELASEGEGCEDWEYGAQLIRYSYFEEYAQQLAEDIGAIDSNASWPNNYIDWERAARELRMDYSAISFNGVTYYVR